MCALNATVINVGGFARLSQGFRTDGLVRLTGGNVRTDPNRSREGTPQARKPEVACSGLEWAAGSHDRPWIQTISSSTLGSVLGGTRWDLVWRGRPRKNQDSGQGRSIWRRQNDQADYRILPPAFNQWLYSLDTFVPIINFGQKDYWMPRVTCTSQTPEQVYTSSAITSICVSGINGLYLYRWWHIFVGWSLTTLVVAGFTNLIRKE
jgi:hypothetical protein